MKIFKVLGIYFLYQTNLVKLNKVKNIKKYQ